MRVIANIKLNVRPTDTNPISITSNGKMGIWGEAGAKVKIWEWHIAWAQKGLTPVRPLFCV